MLNHSVSDLNSLPNTPMPKTEKPNTPMPNTLMPNTPMPNNSKSNLRTMKLSDYVVWYHSITDDDWSKASYINLCKDLPNQCVATIGDLSKIYICFKEHIT